MTTDLAPPSASVRSTIPERFAAQRAYAPTIKRRSAVERIAVLERLQDAILKHRTALHEGVYADFSKSATDVDLTELAVILGEIKEARSHLRRWMRPHKLPNTILQFGTTSRIHYEPKGTSLIIAPWNYPVQLVLAPLVSAIAAGCTAIIKPSEFTPHTNAALRALLADVFPPEEVCLIEGAVDVAQALLSQPFDHIFFTGSPTVGKIIMRAAAEHLTSVTLELGGKSPTIIDASVNVDAVAKKVAWGKFTNSGQTCIAPDHVYVHRNVYASFLAAFQAHVETMYGEALQGSAAVPGYPALIHARHAQRMQAFIDDAKNHNGQILQGGTLHQAERHLTPTLIVDANTQAELMQEEIFGPILPVFPYDDIDDVLAEIAARPKALTLYIFSEEKSFVQTVLNGTSAGTTCVNDTLIHFANGNMPFGGINTSGLGKSHGFAGFQAFSNARGVMTQHWTRPLFQLIYPPYTNRTHKIVKYLFRFLTW